MRGALHPADLLGEQRASVTGCGTSYGMSTQVVTPPAAALRVAPSMPGQPDRGRGVHVPVDQAGQDQLAAVVERLGGGRRRALADRGDGLAARRDETVAQNGRRR